MKNNNKYRLFPNSGITKPASTLFIGALAILLALMMVVGTFFAKPLSNTNAEITAKTNSDTEIIDEHPNDPVIYEGANGIQIKIRNALTNTALNGYPYITMGSYGGKALNWFIAGYKDISWIGLNGVSDYANTSNNTICYF